MTQAQDSADDANLWANFTGAEMPSFSLPERVDITDAASFQTTFQWSDAAIEKLRVYESTLQQWQNAVNLIAPSTRDLIWHRHFADSAQLLPYIDEKMLKIADLGTGGGFPGLVLAVGLEDRAAHHITLVESDQRKAAFLREAARRMEISVEILSTRIETDATVNALAKVNTITARAFAPLRRLFAVASPLFGPETKGIFLKGARLANEIEDAQRHWTFDVAVHQSKTDQSGQIAVVQRLQAITEA